MGIRDRLAGKAKQVTNGDFPETFRFTEPGDEVAGVVNRVATDVETDYGDADVVEIDDELQGEPVAIWATNLQLKQALIEGQNDLDRPVQKGDEVYVRYEGSTQTKKGNTVKNYAVAVDEGSDEDDDTPF